MKSCLGLTLAGGLILVAGTAHAQSQINPGASVQGRLSSQDPKLDDGSHYRCFTLQTSANTVYTVTLESDDFDAFLSAGAGANCEDLAMANDDGPDMGTNARLTFASEGGAWMIRTNTLSADETGAFTLSVSRGEAIVPTRDIIPLTLGASTTGELSFGDRRADDGSLYDCYRLQMRSEDTLSVRLDADDFDAYLGLYDGGTCEGVARASDDDSGGGTSAQIVERLPAGTYSIRANSLGSDGTGNYTLTATVRR